MSDFFSVYVYFALVALVTIGILAFSILFPSRTRDAAKFMPYESGIQTETHLLKERFPMRHYLVALIFLVLDVEVIFLYPWAVVGKSIGIFAFYEILFFLVPLLIGLAYLWRKGGLQWE